VKENGKNECKELRERNGMEKTERRPEERKREKERRIGKMEGEGTD
jgi:hypothetical protein